MSTILLCIIALPNLILADVIGINCQKPALIEGFTPVLKECIVDYYPPVSSCDLAHESCTEICEGRCEPGYRSYDCPKLIRSVKIK